MEQMGFVLCEIAFLIAAVIFVKQEERRANFKVSILISSVVFAVIILLSSKSVHYDSMFIEMLFQVMITTIIVLYLKINWEVSFSIAFYDTLWARLFWWMLIEIEHISYAAVVHFYGITWEWGLYIGLLLFFSIGFFILAQTVARWIPKDKKHIGPRQMLLTVLIATLFENMAISPELRMAEAGFDRWLILFLLQLICMIVLYLQNELFRKSAMKQELELVNLLLQKEQEQYRLSKENISIINQKCHDLKHQIRAIRKSEDADKSRYLKEVEDSIRIYEAIVKTGNEVLDTILTEKSLYCQERGINISCVADGGLLSFMETMDLYSLFGNALDNAIEAVEKLSEEAMRQIDVLIFKQESFLVIHIINPVDEPLIFEEGLPVTTKKDKNFHGFGVRSMQYIVKKYDGCLNASEEDGCFSLKILIPMSLEEKHLRAVMP